MTNSVITSNSEKEKKKVVMLAQRTPCVTKKYALCILVPAATRFGKMSFRYINRIFLVIKLTE